MKTNEESLVKISVVGEVRGALKGSDPYDVSAHGEPLVYPGVGGVTYNVRPLSYSFRIFNKRLKRMNLS